MVEWSNSFSVKHMGIDEQHKKLIGIIGEFILLMRNRDYEFVYSAEVVSELNNCINKHFRYEEALMEKYSYLEAGEHIRQHNELRDKMAKLNVFDMKSPIKFYYDILSYLVNWLSKHIMQTDKKFGLYLSEKNVKAAMF